jgi:hypothetical protein
LFFSKETGPNSMSDSRSENREKGSTIAAGELISASLTPEGTDEEILAFVFDTIDKGFQISIPQNITPRTIVYFTITRQSENGVAESEKFIARISWCKKDMFIGGFDVGVEILSFAPME